MVDPYTPAGEPGVVGPLDYCRHGNWIGNEVPCGECQLDAAAAAARRAAEELDRRVAETPQPRSRRGRRR